MRLDTLIRQRQLSTSRERAQLLIGAGLVTVNGIVVTRSSELVDEEAVIEVTGEAMPYVGRGGVKLDISLKQFRLNVRGAVCLDVGSSTGGFSDCLLQRGAKHITAIDVGHGQMAKSISDDPRVELREGVNARYVTPDQFEAQFDIAVIDVSFISLKLVLPAIVPLVRPGGHIVALVKPEFEAGREAVGPRGIVRNHETRRRALSGVLEFAKTELSLEVRNSIASPLTGGSGNHEFLACFRLNQPEPSTADSTESEDEMPGTA